MTAEMLGEEECTNEEACVTDVSDGILSMGCLNSTKHWENIFLCFAAPSPNITTLSCSYDPETLAGFNRWGVGMCCCREEKCNELPPEWLSLPMWRFRYRVLSIFLIVFTVFSVVFFYWGKIEAQNTLEKEKKRKRVLKLEIYKKRSRK